MKEIKSMKPNGIWSSALICVALLESLIAPSCSQSAAEQEALKSTASINAPDLHVAGPALVQGNILRDADGASKVLGSNDAASIDEALYGQSVAISGDLVAVCAPNTTVDGKAKAGSVQVLRRTDQGVFPIVNITSGNAQPNARYGESCALHNGRLAFTAPGENKVFQFDCSANWCSSAPLPSITVAGLGSFTVDGHRLGGPSLSVSDTHLVVGAPQDSLVYVSTRDAWSPMVWQIQDNQGTKMLVNFGASVAIDGDGFVAGAPTFPRVFNGNPWLDNDAGGAAYLFERSQAGSPGCNDNNCWGSKGEVPVGRVTGFSFDGNERFGAAVAIDRHSWGPTTVILVGAPTADSTAVIAGHPLPKATDTGRVFAYTRKGDVYKSNTSLAPYEDFAQFDAYRFGGAAVALDANRVVVGYPGAPDQAHVGSARVFNLGVTDEGYINTLPQIVNFGTSPESMIARFGSSVAISQEHFIAVGAPATNDSPFRGAGYVFDPSDGPVTNFVFGPSQELQPVENRALLSQLFIPIVQR